MRRILCFGDSNTWGYIAGSGERYPETVRWTGLLSALLGEDYRVLEEGLCGRTTDFEDEIQPGRKAAGYLVPCLLSHLPLDLIVLMLGTNDTKRRYRVGAEEIRDSMENLLRSTLDCLYWEKSKAKVLLVAPPPMTEEALQDRQMDSESVQKSKQLGGLYRTLAQKLNVPFLDAAECELSLQTDGCHLSTEGHARFAEIMAQKVNELLL